MKIENAFYSKGGIRQGQPTVRVATEIEVLMDLVVCQTVFERAVPLVDRLRRRTIRRHQYEALVAIMTENALITGQPDETQLLMVTLERMWRRCPDFYLSRLLAPLRVARLKVKRWIGQRVEQGR